MVMVHIVNIYRTKLRIRSLFGIVSALIIFNQVTLFSVVDEKFTSGLKRQNEYETPWASKLRDVTVRTTARDPNKCICVECEEDEICGGLWKADNFPIVGQSNPHTKRIHIVVSHCKNDLYWISNFTNGYDIVSTHVITKCGLPVNGAPANATIEALPNVGRCDHTYAYYIKNILDKKIVEGEENDSIAVFLKDDMSKENFHQVGKWNTFENMVRIASSINGFSCGADCADPNRKRGQLRSYSPYHNVTHLFDFQMEGYYRKNKTYANLSDVVEFKSNFTNLGSFYQSVVGRSLPELVQVCYGGIFAASYLNIKRVDPSIWEKIESILSRGDNIEEGHLMERSWASLLATPLQPFQIEGLNNYKEFYHTFTEQENMIRHLYIPGALFKSKTVIPPKKNPTTNTPKLTKKQKKTQILKKLKSVLSDANQ